MLTKINNYGRLCLLATSACAHMACQVNWSRIGDYHIDLDGQEIRSLPDSPVLTADSWELTFSKFRTNLGDLSFCAEEEAWQAATTTPKSRF